MTDIQPLPPEMLAGGVEQFARELPVKSVQVEDHRGVTEYGPPEEAPRAPQTPSGTFSPPWAHSGPQSPPMPPPSAPAAPPRPQAPAPIAFTQPNVPQPTEEADPFGKDLTLEERVEWLEEQVQKLWEVTRGG